MANDVTPQGVPMDDDELADPSDNNDAPDPLIGESATPVGALSKIGSINDKQSVAANARSGMGDLQAQYGRDQGMLGNAYGAQKKALEDAAQRVLSMQFGPNKQEAAYRVAAAIGTGDQAGRYNPGGINAAHANVLQQQREGEQRRQELLTQYGAQIPQAQIGQAGANIKNDIQLMRLQQSAVNQANGKADVTPALRDKYLTQDPNDPSKWVDNPALRQADIAQKAQEVSDAAKARIAAQASAAGMVSPEAVEIAYRTGKPPAGFSRNLVVNKQLWDGVHARAQQDGNDPAATFAMQQGTQAMGGVIKDFQSGKTAGSIDGINTAVAHTNILLPLVDALDNGDVTKVNAAKQWFANQMGEPAPNDFNATRDFVAGEIAKAVLPGGGGEAERQALSASAKAADSPRVLRSIIADKWPKLLAGKTDTLRNRWDVGTGGTQGDFNKFLLPATKHALGIKEPLAALPARPGQSEVAPINSLVSKWLPKPAGQ